MTFIVNDHRLLKINNPNLKLLITNPNIVFFIETYPQF